MSKMVKVLVNEKIQLVPEELLNRQIDKIQSNMKPGWIKMIPIFRKNQIIEVVWDPFGEPNLREFLNEIILKYGAIWCDNPNPDDTPEHDYSALRLRCTKTFISKPNRI